MEDKRSIKNVLERQENMHEKVVNQSNSELPSSSPTRSPGPHHSSVIQDCSFLFLLVFSIHMQGHSLLGEANSCVHGLVSNGAVVL
jgi:hypothetical protein